MNNAPLLRSVLYVPAINQRAIAKARLLEADALVFDLEDSAAPDSKDQAREHLLEAFSQNQFGGSFTVIRVNAIDSTDYLKDLDVVQKCNPEAILLPKVSGMEEIQLFEQDAIKNGFSESLRTWFMVETVAGLVNLEKVIASGIACRYPLQTLVVGHNDLAREVGVSYGEDRKYFLPWLMNILLHANYNGLEVLDSVWNHFKDLDGFKAEALQAKHMGFSGKTLIHPSQVEIVNEVFMADADEIAEARLIIAAYLLPENTHAGVINLNGRMVERLHLQQAVSLLDKHGLEP